MGTYIARRVVISIPVLLGITILTFSLVDLVPGDPVTMVLSPEQLQEWDEEYIQRQREKLGLTKPMPVRYVLWLDRLLHGDMGYSLISSQPVIKMIQRRLPATLRLTVTALVISTIIGIGVGMISGLFQYSVFDHVLTFLSFAGVSVPEFFLALALIYLLGLRYDFLPVSGMNTLGVPPTFSDGLTHLILPATVLGIRSAASLVRYARSSILEVIHEDYVRTARAKGLREPVVIIRHAFRNGLLPLITVIALRVPGLFAGAVIIEQIFNWPGLGTLGINSAIAQDYPVLMGLNLSVAAIIMGANLLADVCYAIADPRIRYD